MLSLDINSIEWIDVEKSGGISSLHHMAEDVGASGAF